MITTRSHLGYERRGIVGRASKICGEVTDNRSYRFVFRDAIALQMKASEGLGNEFRKVRQVNRKATLRRCVELVLDLHADGIARGVALEIESGGGLERTIRIQSEEGIVSVTGSGNEVVGQTRPDIRIGGVEFSNHRTDRLIFREGEGGGGVEIGGVFVGLPEGETKSDVIESIGWEVAEPTSYRQMRAIKSP